MTITWGASRMFWAKTPNSGPKWLKVQLWPPSAAAAKPSTETNKSASSSRNGVSCLYCSKSNSILDRPVWYPMSDWTVQYNLSDDGDECRSRLRAKASVRAKTTGDPRGRHRPLSSGRLSGYEHG